MDLVICVLSFTIDVDDYEPQFYIDIMNFSDYDKWYGAIYDKMNFLKMNKTLIIVYKPNNVG